VSGVLASLVPVFAVILLGGLLKRGRLVADAFWQPAEAITFYIFFPALLLSNTATAKLRGVEVAPMLAALLAGILAVTALTFTLRRPLRLDGPAFTSLLQGAIRPNIYVGLAAAQALFGREGLALLSVAVAFAVPLVNVVSVLAMLRWAAAPGSRLGASSILLPLLGNPLIVSCVIGLALNVVGLGLPPLVAPCWRYSAGHRCRSGCLRSAPAST
jgi:malonate transporter and related proteins